MARHPDRAQLEQTPKRVLTIFASLVKRGWMRRVILLQGDVDAQVEYDGRKLGIGIAVFDADYGADSDTERLPTSSLEAEVVSVNGAAVPVLGRHRLLGEGHLLRFEIPAADGPIVVQVRVTFTESGLLRIEDFRLVVNGVTVYDETRAGTVVSERCTLPLPSSADDVATNSLPVVGVEPFGNERVLPIPGRIPDPADD